MNMTIDKKLIRVPIQDSYKILDKITVDIESLTATANRIRASLQTLEVGAEETYTFSPSKARQVRENSGISPKGLAVIINDKVFGRNWGSSEMVIRNYEKGFLSPGIKKSRVVKGYLDWLKEKGYNPFDI